LAQVHCSVGIKLLLPCFPSDIATLVYFNLLLRTKASGTNITPPLHTHTLDTEIYSIKMKVKVKFTLEQTFKAHRGVEVWFKFFFKINARWGQSATHPCRFTPEKETSPIIVSHYNEYANPAQAEVCNSS
jgi:hypothetical protein